MRQGPSHTPPNVTRVGVVGGFKFQKMITVAIGEAGREGWGEGWGWGFGEEIGRWTGRELRT